MGSINMIRFNAHKLLAALSLGLFASVASATPYTIDAVMQGSDGGFAYSLLHAASDPNPMSGATQARFLSATGAYDDATGVFVGSFDIDSNQVDGNLDGVSDGTLTLSGILGFTISDADPWLDAAVSTLSATFSAGMGFSNTTFGFMPGDVCCGGSGAGGTPGLHPNSFAYDAGTNAYYLTLWGANGTFNGGASGAKAFYDGQDLGIDLRVKLSPVPEPGLLLVLGTGLLGLGVSRRRKFPS